MSEAAVSVSDRRLARAGQLPRAARAVGSLFVSARRDGSITRLAELRQYAPCRALFPQIAPGEPLHAVLVNTSGGLVEGDRIGVEADAQEGARLLLTTQAAEKVYRSLQSTCETRTRLRVGPRADLEWLPQETILFDGSRLSRSLDADVDPAGRLLAAECLVFGRSARGETLTHGFLRDRWSVRRDGRLVWADALRLDGDLPRMLRRDFGFGASAGCATIVLADADAASFLPLARAAAEQGPWIGGATLVNGVLVARALAPSEAVLRRGCEQIVAALRGARERA